MRQQGSERRGRARPVGVAVFGRVAVVVLAMTVGPAVVNIPAAAQIIIGGGNDNGAVIVDQGVLDALGPSPSQTGVPASPVSGMGTPPAAAAPIDIRPQAPPEVHPGLRDRPMAGGPAPSCSRSATSIGSGLGEPAWTPPHPEPRPVMPASVAQTGAPATSSTPIVPAAPIVPADAGPSAALDARPPVVPPLPAARPAAPRDPASAGERPDGRDVPERPATVAEAPPALPDNDGVVTTEQPRPPDPPAVTAGTPPALPPAVPRQPTPAPERPAVVAGEPPERPQILVDRPAAPTGAAPELSPLSAEQTELAALPPAEGPGTPIVQQTMTIAFPPETETLPDGAVPILDGLAQQMADDPGLRVQVLAYASGGSGSAARSISLSRAIAVRSFLMDREIRRTRIDVRALGDTAEDGALDRIDLVVVP